MKTYYCDLGWRGGVVIVAENEEEAFKILREDNGWHSKVDNLVELKPREVYTFYGDS